MGPLNHIWFGSPRMPLFVEFTNAGVGTGAAVKTASSRFKMMVIAVGVAAVVAVAIGVAVAVAVAIVLVFVFVGFRRKQVWSTATGTFIMLEEPHSNAFVVKHVLAVWIVAPAYFITDGKLSQANQD